MTGSEWTLVFFTLITQMCVGGFILQDIMIHYRHHDDPNILKVKKGILRTLLPLIIIAVILSFFHLGKPVHAIYSLNNLQSSWLSREIMLVSVFAILLISYALIFWRYPESRSLLKIIAILEMITGLFLIYSMSRIYTLSTIPVWNSMATPVEFFTASFLLGGLLLMLVFQRRLFKLEIRELANFSRRISVLYLLLIIFLMIDLGNTIYYHYIDYEISRMTAEDTSYIINLTKSILHIASILILIPQFYQFNIKKHFSGVLGFRIIFFLLILAELIGRYGFYASYVSPGF